MKLSKPVIDKMQVKYIIKDLLTVKGVGSEELWKIAEKPAHDMEPEDIRNFRQFLSDNKLLRNLLYTESKGKNRIYNLNPEYILDQLKKPFRESESEKVVKEIFSIIESPANTKFLIKSLAKYLKSVDEYTYLSRPFSETVLEFWKTFGNGIKHMEHMELLNETVWLSALLVWVDEGKDLKKEPKYEDFQNINPSTDIKQWALIIKWLNKHDGSNSLNDFFVSEIEKL